MEEAMAAFLSQFESNGKDRGQMSEVRDQTPAHRDLSPGGRSEANVGNHG